MDAQALGQRIRELNDELQMSAKWESARLDELIKLVEDRARDAQAQATQSARQLADRQLERDLEAVKQSAKHKREEAIAHLKFSAEARRRTFLTEQFALRKAKAEAESRDRLLAAETAEKSASDAEVEQKVNIATAEAVARRSAIADNEDVLATLKATYGRISVWEKKSIDLHKLSGAVAALEFQLQSGQPVAEALGAVTSNSVAADSGGTALRAAAKALAAAGATEGFPTRPQLRDAFEKTVKPAARTALYVPANQKGAAGQVVGRVRSVAPSLLPSLSWVLGSEGEAYNPCFYQRFSRVTNRTTNANLETRVKTRRRPFR